MMTFRIQGVVWMLLACCGMHAAGDARDWLKKPDAWFRSDEAAGIADNILSWQSQQGGWPKNVDVTAGPFRGDRDECEPTFDNGATTDELRFLARMISETQDRKYRRAFDRGFEYILDAQYRTGGWPQRYPSGDGYHRYITFNDNAMVRVMEFLRETWTDDRYDFMGSSAEREAQRAFEKGIDCILKCQIRVNGQLTAWCAQHDERNYEPRPARVFELESISGSESVGIVELLMSLENPSPEIVRAVDAAVAWFRAVEIRGIRIGKVNGDKTVIPDEAAPALWARFYEIGTNRPIFCGRTGMKKYALEEIDEERRNNYSWYGTWPQRLLEQDYPAWKQRVD